MRWSYECDLRRDATMVAWHGGAIASDSFMILIKSSLNLPDRTDFQIYYQFEIKRILYKTDKFFNLLRY